jgi:hypothetical protein
MDQPRARTVGRGLAMGPWLRHTNRANMGPRHRGAGRRGVGRGEVVVLASGPAADCHFAISYWAGVAQSRPAPADWR